MVDGQRAALPLDNFREASERVLDVLFAAFELALWMITAVRGDDWVVLAARDRTYGLGDLPVLRWSDSCCYQMVAGYGPRIAPDAGVIPAYRDAPLASRLAVGAYIGLPLVGPGGNLFGTLCALDPAPQAPRLLDAEPLLTLQADLLSALLTAEHGEAEQSQRAIRAETEARTDVLTGLLNRRGWEHTIAIEHARSSRYGEPASIVVIDIDGLKRVNDLKGHHEGDRLILDTATALRHAARASDAIARLGGDEFGVIAPHTDPDGAYALLARLGRALQLAGISASIGCATRLPGAEPLRDTWRRADARMYAEKRRRPRSAARLRL